MRQIDALYQFVCNNSYFLRQQHLNCIVVL